MAAPAPAPHPPAPPAPRRRLPAVLAAAAVCLSAGYTIGATGAPGVDLVLFAEEVQRFSSAEAGVRYDPDSPGEGSDPLPVEVLLMREPTPSGDEYSLRLGHHPAISYHEVGLPTAAHIAHVDWGTDRITVRFDSGHTLGVPSRYAVGLR